MTNHSEYILDNPSEFGMKFEKRLNDRNLNGNNGDNDELFGEFAEEYGEYLDDQCDPELESEAIDLGSYEDDNG